MEKDLAIITSANLHDAADHEVNVRAILLNPVGVAEAGAELSMPEKLFALQRLGYGNLRDFDALPVGATFMLEKIQHIDVPLAIDVLEKYLVKHHNDVNVPMDEYENIERLMAERETHSLGDSSNSKDSKDVAEKLGGHVTVVTELESDVRKEIVEETVRPAQSLDALAHTLRMLTSWEMQVKVEAAIIAYHSPYQEVRSVTDPFDDPTIPCETLRMYIAGLIWTAAGTFVDQFFSQRQPKITLSTSCVQLLLYPTGMLMAYIFPKWKFRVWRYEIDLNPGPWSHKEQMLATLFYSVLGGVAYVSYNIHVLKVKRYYGVTWVTWGYQILLMLSTNFLGFGLAGIMRKFAVYPEESLWPTLMSGLALNKALTQQDSKEKIGRWTISRYRFFFYVFTFSFLYFWFPDYIFQALSTFNWLSWIAPHNLNLATITGSVSGLGLNPVTSFDWNILNYNSPLVVPFYSILNQYIGSAIAFFCIIGVWYSNYKWTAFLPINSNALFTNTGNSYQVKQILDKENLLDKDKFHKYGLPFYTAANMVTYGTFFAIYPFSFVYTIGVNFKEIVHLFKSLGMSFRDIRRSGYDGFEDPFSRSMSKYKEVPEWCYTIVILLSIMCAILSCKLYPAETPVWGIFFAIGINFVFLVPFIIIYSRTGFSFGLNVLVELIVGYALPGNGLALMTIKAFGYNIDGQAENYITNQKQAHYLRIPPRALFRTQMLSVLMYSFISLATMNFTFHHIKDYCDPKNRQKFSCPDATTFYSSSVIWGVIGPKRVFQELYPILKWCFLIGALLPIPCILIKKYFSHYRAVRYFQPVLIMGGFLIFAPYNLSYYTPSLILCYIFMVYLRKQHTAWWSKYNYVLSGAMTAGVALAGVIIFFSVQYHPKPISWWGNNVMYAGLDGAGVALKNATIEAPDGYFGPRLDTIH